MPATAGPRRWWRLLAALISVAAVLQPSRSFTDESDVIAINSLYLALGSPSLPGWTANGGDPCADQWQGVQCVISNITSITINAANLGGQLSDSLGNFSSIITLDLSNNNIGGIIPASLPVTMQRFFLSANQLTGSIPSSLSSLTLLTDLSLNNNHLVGHIPDAFAAVTGLINLDLSNNNLTGPLPPSMSSLSSLTTLHVQDNQITGTLNVLEDIPLNDLNIENNLFSGPIPVKLFSIPNFKKDGNPFNTTVLSPPPAMSPLAPEPLPSSPISPISGALLPPNIPANSPDAGPVAQHAVVSRNNSTFILRTAGYVLIAVISFIIVALWVIFCLSKWEEKKRSRELNYATSQVSMIQGGPEKPKITAPLPVVKARNNNVEEDAHYGRPRQELNLVPTAIPKKHETHEPYAINLGQADASYMPPAPLSPLESPPPPPPPPPPATEKVTIDRLIQPGRSIAAKPKTNKSSSASSFSVAFLQQCTNSFREGNLIRETSFGKVYLAELPDGKLLEVMKIDKISSRIPEDDFLEIVVNLSELRHRNILELVGYCAEYGQRLLVYNHFSRKTLHDALHDEDDLRIDLSWNARLRIVLESAMALEYLHESCQPPIAHQKFEAASVLIDNKLAVCVSECGLGALMTSNSITQLSGHMHAMYGYEAPEVNELGSFTDRSDVYSLGVVMLELLTGRKPYDSSRPREERHLVRWASSVLHDIDALSHMVDPSIRGQWNEKELSQVADIISRSILREPEFRPPMSQIVQDLANIIKSRRSKQR